MFVILFIINSRTIRYNNDPSSYRNNISDPSETTQSWPGSHVILIHAPCFSAIFRPDDDSALLLNLHRC